MKFLKIVKNGTVEYFNLNSINLIVIEDEDIEMEVVVPYLDRYILKFNKDEEDFEVNKKSILKAMGEIK